MTLCICGITLMVEWYLAAASYICIRRGSFGSAMPCVGWIIRPNIFKAALLANISASMLSKRQDSFSSSTTIFTYVKMLAEMDRVRHSNACANSLGCCSGTYKSRFNCFEFNLNYVNKRKSTCENLHKKPEQS